MRITDMMGITVGSVFAGETIRTIGMHMSGGIGKATQTLVGVGFLGHVAGKAKDSFNWMK